MTHGKDVKCVDKSKDKLDHMRKCKTTNHVRPHPPWLPVVTMPSAPLTPSLVLVFPSHLQIEAMSFDCRNVFSLLVHENRGEGATRRASPVKRGGLGPS